MLITLLFQGCETVEQDFDPREQTRSSRMAAPTTFAAIDDPRSIPPELLRPSREPYLLGIGDVLELEIAEVPGSRSVTFIMPDGRLYFDLAGGVTANGLTLPQLKEHMEKALAHDYANPQVNINLMQVNSRRYWMLGRVFKPGLYPLEQPTTLLEAISTAGGLFTSRFSGSTEELADLTRSFVMRDGEIIPVDFQKLMRQGDTSQNIYLKSDDYIYLPSALSANVYVLGEVRQSQAVGYKDNLTLVGAIAAAKGPTPLGRMEEVIIIRGSLQEPQVAVVNFRDILQGKATDVRLKAFDIVWVPKDPWERLEKYVFTVINTAMRTIAVREGASAANLEGASATPVIPVN